MAFLPKPSYKMLCYTTIVFFLLSSSFAFLLFRAQNETKESEKKFELLDQNIAELDTDNFLKQQKTYTIRYDAMRQDILEVISSKPNQVYGIYFEDMLTGSWVGINERELFSPSSLLKVPIVIATMKEIEEGRLSLDQKITLVKEDLDGRSGLLALEGEGHVLTVRELIKFTLQKSDNTAAWALLRQISDENFQDTQEAIGIFIHREGPSEELSPKRMSNAFRSLYYSTYLNRASSNYILSLTTNTDYNQALPSALPPEVKIAHKVGFWLEKKNYHDCGIVYFPKNPYMLCIMSKNVTKSESDKTMHQISKIVYEHTAQK